MSLNVLIIPEDFRKDRRDGRRQAQDGTRSGEQLPTSQIAMSRRH